MNIHLHIEHLVLEGLPVTGPQGALIQAALESELTRLLGAEGLPGASSAALKNLSGGTIQLAATSHPAPTGNQIAQAVYTSLSSLGAAPRIPPGGGRRQA
jgi:hypothetical protein